MRCDSLRRVLVVVVAGLLILPATLFTQQKPSQADSARLSSLSGSVTVKRPGAEAIPAQVNTPIEEGVELSTAAGSSATVRLEGASTIQFSALTKADFTKLTTDTDGIEENIVTLAAGLARFHLIPDKRDNYKVQVADATVSTDGRADFQAAFTGGTVRVRVLAGSVTVSAHDGSLTLERGRFLEYNPSDEAGVPKSHARVVRLSYLTGTVMLKRPGWKEEEKALLNTPIQEGFELSTASGSYAEVEFENGSTARIGEQSKLLFEQLALDAHGNKLNGMGFEQGYGTFNFVPERQPRSPRARSGAIRFQPNDQDTYRVKLADATVRADGKCEFRADLTPEHYRVEVFKGSVEVATNQESTRLAQGSVLVHESGGPVLASNTSKGITKDAWDQWTEARDRQALLTYGDEAIHATGPSYGWGELNTFGEWITLPGGRFGWSPYATAGWSPYTFGTWQWYPGMDWTWISGDPWGWVTDHCGMWQFDPYYGWYWMSPMFGCGFWWPSLVNWYAGPGWVGWLPGRPTHVPPVRPRPGPGPRPFHPVPQIIKVPTSVVQNRQLITAEMVSHLPATAASRIEQPAFEPIPRNLPEGNSAAAAGAHVPAVAAGARLGFARATAPPSILMGGDAGRESSLLAHHGFRSGREPLRAAQGTTLGGHYEVYGSRGEFRGNAAASGGAGGRSGGPIISSASSGSGPVVASHGSSAGGSSGSGGSSSGTGGGNSSGGGGGMVSGGSSSSGSAHASGSGGGGGGGGGHH